MLRSFNAALALAILLCSLTSALADDTKSAAVTTEQTAQPKIRVILPASWEPAIPSTAPQPTSQQRNAAR